MEQGPIPPHERTWRHPSELAPTRSDVDLAPRGKAKQSVVFAAATGTLAIAAVAILLIAVTPDRSGAPLTLSATTSPPVIERTARQTGPVAAQPTVGLASFTPIPYSVTALSPAPTPATTNLGFADEVPALDEAVFVVTGNATYHTVWSQVSWLSSPEGATILDSSGEIVAYLRTDTLFIVAEVHVDD